VGGAVMLAALALAGTLAAAAQAPPVRLAAPSDCATNPNCAAGLKRIYRIDPGPGLVKLQVADAGVQALDNGLAEVAVVFSSNPDLSRPDIVTLRDDRQMVGEDHIVPVVRSSLLERYGAPLRRRLNAASRLLTTLALRGLNQQVIDGRLPEAVGGEFADANGLGGTAKRRAGPRIVMGYQEFDENRTLAHFYAEALRGAGFRVTVRSSGGLRKQAVAGIRSGRLGIYPGYSTSLRKYLGGRTLARALARIRARPMALSRAQDSNTFAMKSDLARTLGVTKISDLARYWPAAASGARLSADPLQAEQWAVQPQSVMDLPGAWRLSQGAGATVAIVDTGAKLDHPDLAPNIWTNFREVPGNGVDDDNNGYVDDVHGVDLTTTGATQDLGDGNGHGTHVAGIVAAAANGRGVVGVAPRAKLMVVKVMDAQGRGTTGAVAEGIRYAAANGARVINVSIQGDDPDPRMDAAIAAAGAANALVVVSAGNSARDIDAKPSYPAAIPAPNLIGVAATAPEDGRSLDPYSNYGRLNVQLAAPGEEILSSSNSGAYEVKSGTSMAAPMVAGVAALMVAANPRVSAADLRGLLLQHATRSRLPVGAGYLDALDAVLAASTAVGFNSTQAPQLRILSATVKGRRTQIQAALLGSAQAVKRYRVLLDGKRAAQLAARRSPFTVTLRRPARRVRIEAIAASGKALTRAQGTISKLKAGKRGVKQGHGVGT
jgi:subtilisin family serine protease